MKKIVAFLMALMLTINIQAGAITLENTNAYWVYGVHTDYFNNDPDVQAEMLKELGLFKGTDRGFELERSITRAEMAVMLVRFLGVEKTVLSGAWQHPFTDVPVWADKYIGWLYQSGLVKGISADKYGASQAATLTQYATFLSRAISGNDDWLVNGIATADEESLCDEVNHLFTRAAAVGLTARALTITYTKGGDYSYSMAQYLINQGVFTVEQLSSAAWGVLPPTYSYLDDKGYLYNTIAGITIAKTDVGGIRSKTGEDSDQAYFYATASSGQEVKLYKIDCKTMETALISTKTVTGDSGTWYYEYADTIGGKDYLIEYSNTDCVTNLVRSDGSELTTVLADLDLYKGSHCADLDYNYFVGNETLVLACADKYYYIDAIGLTEHSYAAETQIVGYDGTSLVTQLPTDKSTTIACLNASNGAVVDSYSVAQDTEDKNDYRTISQMDYGRYYGEAGLYLLGDGRLNQITARPTLDIMFLRNDERYIILTHETGERIWGMNDLGGNEIIMIEDDGTENVLLGNTPAHEISIAAFSDTFNMVSFYSAADVGMQHFNEYTYLLLSNSDGTQPQIQVTSYTAGRPELEAEGYEQTYIDAEQARLDALGY